MELTDAELALADGFDEHRRTKFVYLATSTMDRMQRKGVADYREQAIAYAMKRCTGSA